MHYNDYFFSILFLLIFVLIKNRPQQDLKISSKIYVIPPTPIETANYHINCSKQGQEVGVTIFRSCWGLFFIETYIKRNKMLKKLVHLMHFWRFAAQKPKTCYFAFSAMLIKTKTVFLVHINIFLNEKQFPTTFVPILFSV